MHTELPLVSVIIPSYNRAEYIMDAIESVWRQTYSHWEVIVVDDGSTDRSPEILQSLPGIIYIRQEHSGQGAARNEGLKYAKGDVIASLDSDDIWQEDFLHHCVRKLISGEHDFVFANWERQRPDGSFVNFIDHNTHLLVGSNTRPDGWTDLSHDDLRKLYCHRCPAPSSACVIRRSSLPGGWNTYMKIADDWHLHLDIIFSGTGTAAFYTNCLWKKRLTSNNIYDNRKQEEVLEELYIDDIGLLLQTFSPRMTQSEVRQLQKSYVNGMVLLSILKLKSDRDLLRSFGYLYTAMKISFSQTHWAIWEIVHFQIKKRMKIRVSKS